MAERIAIVTGTAQGIGLAVTRVLLQNRLTVVGVDVNDEALAATAQQLTATGASFTPKVADLTDPDQVQQLFAEIERKPAAARPSLKPLILVVEDNAINLQITVELLESVGARVETACNGLHALRSPG